MKKYALVLFSFYFILTSCSKTNTDNLDITTTVSPLDTAEVDTQHFMWKAMNFWYFWQEDVENLSDTKFPLTEEGSIAYTEFLESYEDPETFFYSICNQHENIVGSNNAIDRFSFVSEDYRELTQALAGVSKSNGLEFGLVLIQGTEDIFGYVRYIIPNSDAATKDISRGEIFRGVNGQALNLDNYIDLLFGDNDTYTLNMADIVDGEIIENDKEVTLTKFEGLAENPVFLSKIFEIGGQKIGYLVYNAFTNEYDEDLNNAIGELKASNIEHLVVDLRYNPGGSVNSARLLSSMIYGTNTDEIFLRQRWNSKIQPQLSDSQLIDYFANQTPNGSAVNSLNLTTVYILTTSSSASSSELVINGLAPYVNVVQIGETTTGKNEFSITMVDDYDNSYIYNQERENRINPDNEWAIQPLVGRNENADGFSDYTSGLIPDIELEEDLENLGVLGDQNEPLLARAIQQITGTTSKTDFTVKMPAKIVTSSKMFTTLKNNMVLDKPIEITPN